MRANDHTRYIHSCANRYHVSNILVSACFDENVYNFIVALHSSEHQSCMAKLE